MNIEALRLLKKVVLAFNRDERLSTVHVALFWSIVQKLDSCDVAKPINISRGQLMESSRILSTRTYHRVLKDLVRFGYVYYYPSYHPAHASQIYLIK